MVAFLAMKRAAAPNSLALLGKALLTFSSAPVLLIKDFQLAGRASGWMGRVGGRGLC